MCNAAEKLEVEQAFGMFNDPGADFESQRMMIKMYNQRQSAVKSGINTDWISKPLRLGVGNKHSLSVELGDKALQAIVDLSYQNIKGVMKGSDRTNINLPVVQASEFSVQKPVDYHFQRSARLQVRDFR